MSGTLDERLAACRRICFDSAPLIYFIEEHPTYFGVLLPLFERLAGGSLDGFTSTIALSEVLVKPLEQSRADLVLAFMHLLTKSRGFTVFPVDRHVARTGAELRAGPKKLRAPDALLLATAVLHDADVFLTNDANLRRREEVNVVFLGDLVGEVE